MMAQRIRQLSRVWNYLEIKPLGVSLRKFPERLTEKGRPSPMAVPFHRLQFWVTLKEETRRQAEYQLRTICSPGSDWV